MFRLLSPFVPVFREVLEVRYLWRAPARLDNRSLEAAIGPEPRTDLDSAIFATLKAFRCLPEQMQAADGQQRLTQA